MINKIRRIKNILKDLNADPHAGPFSCPVCKKNNVGMNSFPVYFLKEAHKYQCIQNIFLTETVNFEHYTCKACLASDRDRLYALYLRDYFEKTEKVDFLDIAPSTSLGNFIKGHKNVNYRSVDLYMEGVTDKADVSDLHIYKDNQFDFILCSHVLEHVPEDAKAIKELYRVLSKTGRAILMVPINLGITETIEDPYSTDIAKNWKFFGQGDHVRVYSRSDYIKRLKDGGFYVEELDIKYFGAEVFEKAAINPTSVLYVGHKNDPRN